MKKGVERKRRGDKKGQFKKVVYRRKRGRGEKTGRGEGKREKMKGMVEEQPTEKKRGKKKEEDCWGYEGGRDDGGKEGGLEIFFLFFLSQVRRGKK